jgi:hypothetical protein
VLEHKGDDASAKKELQEAKRYWKDADRDMSELKQIQTAMAAGK